MSHITRGSRNDYNDWDDNLLVSSSMKERERVDGNLLVSSSLKEDSSCWSCNGTGLVDSGVPMEGDEECYICKERDEE